MTDEAITILRSDQFSIGTVMNPGIVLRDEFGKQADFPLLIVQPTLANRAAPPNGVGVRSIEGDLAFSQTGRTLFRSSYIWYRMTSSSTTLDSQSRLDRLVFESAVQTAPFDLAGGSTWSREILLIPRQTWAAVNWAAFAERVSESCAKNCSGELSLRVRLDNGMSLTEQCAFFIDEHVLAHIHGRERRYFTSPVCASPTLK